MNTLRRTLTAGVLALAIGGVAAPAAIAAETAPAAPASEIGILRIWHATVQCQIVRIIDNNVVRYDRADGQGNTEKAAIDDAARNIPVPAGHYKRHCDAKRIW